jgi:TPP-dependent pyruvate/acetoin dehydrogenase alpha subunit
MKQILSSEDLIRFEEEVCEAFADKKIHAPVHLDNGNEEQLRLIFNNMVEEEDWVMGSWRQHYKCLLKGVPKHEVMQAILQGKSISLCFPKYRVISSAIVGGILPIAVGTAMGIKRSGGTNKVVCFMGEMTSESGIAHECIKYSHNHNLPILWVIEDNGKSVCTPTLPVWNMDRLTYSNDENLKAIMIPAEDGKLKSSGVYRVAPKVLHYRYESKFPHAGTGARINF